MILSFYRDLEKDLLWNLFFRRMEAESMKRRLALWEVGEGWMKVVLISSPALVSMGGVFAGGSEKLFSYGRSKGA